MKILIIHPEATQQPAATTLARGIKKSLPQGAEPIMVNEGEEEDAELVLVVFSLKAGAFAPLVPAFRALRDKKVAFVALMAGAVDIGRLRKCSWGIKKQFCGNEVVGGYFCPIEDEMVGGPSEAEWGKVHTFVSNFYESNVVEETLAVAVNY